MAFELLRTDYVDATFEGLRRYLVSENGDGSVSFHDITNYTVKEKSFFGAKDANTINTAVNAILAALENGTDLYEVFTQFFELQKTLFLEESDAKQGDFAAYIMQLREYMDRKWDELKTEYTGDIQYFKDVQENAFKVWFQMIRDQLTNDVAGHLQTQIGNLELLDTEDKESLVNAVNELKEVDDSQKEQIGNLNDLQTTEKRNIVSAINNVLKVLGDRITNAVNSLNDRITTVTNTLQKSLQDSIATVVKKAGDTMTGTLHSSKATITYLAGNQGNAIINSTARAGEYTMLDKLNSTNGYFTDGVYNGNRELHYTPRATVTAGTNSVAKTAVLLDEDGNTKFPGEVSAPTFKGMATSAKKLASGRHINGMLFDGSGDISNYGYITNYGNNPNGYGMLTEVTCPSLKELTTGAEIIIYSDRLRTINRGPNYLKTENTIALIEQSVCPIKLMEGSLHKFRYYNDKWHAVWSPGTIFREENIISNAEDAAISVQRKLNTSSSYIVIGRGSSLTGNDDYLKISLLELAYYGQNSSNAYIWKEITLGSSGSTARFSISKVVDQQEITIKTPKGSYSEIWIYRLA